MLVSQFDLGSFFSSEGDYNLDVVSSNCETEPRRTLSHICWEGMKTRRASFLQHVYDMGSHTSANAFVQQKMFETGLKFDVGKDFRSQDSNLF